MHSNRPFEEAGQTYVILHSGSKGGWDGYGGGGECRLFVEGGDGWEDKERERERRERVG